MIAARTADVGGLPPAGYCECAGRGTVLVCRAALCDVLRDAVATGGTLHGWASRQPGARALRGRGVAWAVRLTTGPEVVVRHAWHGGVLARVTRDVFLAPTRAPHELAVALRLAAAGVPTPDVLAFATYVVAGPFCRADVVTACVDGADLPAALAAHPAPGDRDAIAAAVSMLMHALWRAGARHADLNARNILVTRAPEGFRALVLDVDRVVFGRPASDAVARANRQRLSASLRKWRAQHGLDISDAEIARMTSPDRSAAGVQA